MPSAVKVICVFLLIITCRSESHTVLAETELLLSNVALLSGSQLNITCRAKASYASVILKRGRHSGSLIPVSVHNPSQEKKHPTNTTLGFADRYSVVSAGQNDAGYYQCDYSKTANSSIGQLVVLDSKVKCGEQAQPNHTIKIISCEATYYSVTLHPTLEWITSIPSENSRMNATAVIETDAPGNVTHKIRSTVNVSYPEMEGISLTCRLYFEPINESQAGGSQVPVVSVNAPEYTDSCTTEPIAWERSTPSAVKTIATYLVPSHTAATTSPVVVNHAITGGTSHSSTNPSSPGSQDSARKSSKSSASGNNPSVQGSQDAQATGTSVNSGSNTPTFSPLIIGILAAAAAIIVILIVAIVYVCGRSRNAGAGCFKKRVTHVHDDSHMIYPPSYQPLVTGAGYQELNVGGECGQSTYSYIDPNKLKSIGANNTASLQHPKKPKSNDGFSPSQSPRPLNKSGKNELSTSCGKLSNVRALPNPPLEDGHTYSTPKNPYEVYDIIEDPTYQQIHQSQLGTTKPVNNDGYLIADLEPSPCSTNP